MASMRPPLHCQEGNLDLRNLDLRMMLRGKGARTYNRAQGLGFRVWVQGSVFRRESPCSAIVPV